MIEKNAKIYVAGHRGLVGSAIYKNLQEKGYTNLVGRTHAELDLLDGVAVKRFFDEERPEYVILAAAHVGGIMANSLYRADFIYQNLQIQQNVIGESYRHGVKKLVFLGSTCIYPRDVEQPMREEALLTSPLEYTNEPYAIAKIAGLKLCESFKRALRDRQDRRPEAVRELQPAIWHQLHRRDAHQPLWAERQFPSGEQPRAAGDASQDPFGQMPE